MNYEELFLEQLIDIRIKEYHRDEFQIHKNRSSPTLYLN
jgi:hypothetical protein